MGIAGKTTQIFPAMSARFLSAFSSFLQSVIKKNCQPLISAN